MKFDEVDNTYTEDNKYVYDKIDNRYHRRMLIIGPEQKIDKQYVITSGDYGVYVYDGETAERKFFIEEK